MTKDEFANELFMRRAKKRLKLPDVAERLGVSAQYIWNLENPKHTLSTERAQDAMIERYREAGL